MFYREKAYTRINWKNRPNLSTPLGAKNLNKMDATINELDDRILEVSSEVEQNRLNIVLMSGEIDALEEDVDENTSRINELSSLAEDVNGLKIVNTASGSTAYMDDASNMNIENIIFYGESTQNGEPTPTNPIPIESKIVNRIDVMGKNLFDIKTLYPRNSTQGGTVTFTDDTAHTSSANQKWATLRSEPFNVKKGNTYTVSFNISNYSASTETLVSVGADEITKHTVIRFTENGHFTQTFIATEDELNMLTVTSNNSSETVTNTFDISELQVEKGTVATTYEPYQSQTVNLSAPIELNGIGDVRDTDKVKRFAKITANELSTFNLNYSVGAISLDNNIAILTDWTVPYQNMLCNIFSNVYSRTELLSNTSLSGIALATSDNGSCTIFFRITDIEQTEEAYNAYLSTTPLEVVFERAEPIETELPQADIDAIKQLHTYKPNTVVMNDADAEMDVHYVADAKIYIDRKFEALASAIVNQ